MNCGISQVRAGHFQYVGIYQNLRGSLSLSLCIYIYIPINSDMELYRDLGHLFVHESTLRFYVKCGCIPKSTYPFWGPRKQESTRIPMASSAWVFHRKNACPRALPKGRPRMEMPPCKAPQRGISTQSVDLGRSVRTCCPGGGFLPPIPLRWTPVLQILEREFRKCEA